MATPAPARGGGPASDIIEAIGSTPLVELQRFAPKPGIRLFAKLEGHNPTGSVKDRIANYMVEAAEASGKLRPGRTILEPTSGNTGIALAMIGRRKGYPVTVVMPADVSPERVDLLRAYGAEIVFSPAGKGTNGSIELAMKLARDPEYYMPYQYGNEANPRAHYETTGPEILAAVPDVDVFVAGLGTGGTLMGVGRRLRGARPNVQVIAAEPNPGEMVQGLRNLEEGFVPPILNLDELDGKIMVNNADALLMTRLLMEREGVFAGVSAGAALWCALRVAQRLERANIVVLFADGGWKYLSTGLWTRELSHVEQDLGGKMLW